MGSTTQNPKDSNRAVPAMHNCMVPHGPDADAFAQASQAQLAPHKLDHTLAFMLESRYAFRPTAYALQSSALDTAYANCWTALSDQFKVQT